MNNEKLTSKQKKQLMEIVKAKFGEYKINDEGLIIPKTCPFCQKTDYSFCIHQDTGGYRCWHLNACGAKGNFSMFLRRFGFGKVERQAYQVKVDMDKPLKPSKEINPAKKLKFTLLTDKALEYVKARGISVQTANKFGMMQTQLGNVAIPINDRDGNFVFFKIRMIDAKKNNRFKRYPAGAHESLFGTQFCDHSKPLIIVSGEFDAISIHEVYGKDANVVSLTAGDGCWQWLDDYWDWLQKFPALILANDRDESAREWESRAAAKLGEEKCSVVDFRGLKSKDINAVLAKHGPEAVKQIISSQREVPLYASIDMGEFQAPMGRQQKYPVSIYKINYYLGGGLSTGRVYLWSGANGNGKSTLIYQIALELLNQNLKVAIYSGEYSIARFKRLLSHMAAGESRVFEYGQFGEPITKVLTEQQQKIDAWFFQRVQLYNNELNLKNTRSEGMLKMFETLARRKNYKVFIVDNIMAANYVSDQASNSLERESEFVEIIGERE